MSTQIDKYSRRKAQTSSISTVVSISLVLFMLGCLVLIVLNAQKLSTYVKENIRFQVFLKEDAKEVEVIRLKKFLDSEQFTRSTEYVTKEEAAKILEQEIGEDFIDFLGYNPLLASIDVNLKAEYTHPDSIAWIEQKLMKNTRVKEVVYSPNLIKQVNRNMSRIGIVILGFSALLMIVAIALINNTIRLAIYSKRFLIRSMQLVGATRGFIKRPFILKGLSQGLYGALIAIVLIMGVIFLVQQQIPAFFEIQDIRIFASLFGIVILLGLLISWISTSLAVRKYLRIDPRKLY